jgi:hypothetical protein
MGELWKWGSLVGASFGELRGGDVALEAGSFPGDDGPIVAEHSHPGRVSPQLVDTLWMTVRWEA